MRALTTITPQETARLLGRYLELRKDPEQKVYGIIEAGELVYWSVSRQDANKKATRWGLGLAEYLGKTIQELREHVRVWT